MSVDKAKLREWCLNEYASDPGDYAQAKRVEALLADHDRLEAENAALRRGHQMKDDDNAHYEDKRKAEVKRLRELLGGLLELEMDLAALQEPTP